MSHGKCDCTEDAIFRGSVRVRQRADGYRFSLDAILLAWFASEQARSRVLDLGSGCGVVSLALAHKRPFLKIDSVEIQDELAELAKQNAVLNGFANMRIYRKDLKTLRGRRWEGKYDLVLSNPPYRALGRGRLNPNREKAVARHELLCTLEEVVAASKRALAPGGYAAFVLLAERDNDLAAAAVSSGLSVLHRCRVFPYRNKAPNLLLALLKPGADFEPSESRLVIYGAKRVYTTAARAILDGEWERIPHPLGSFRIRSEARSGEP